MDIKASNQITLVNVDLAEGDIVIGGRNLTTKYTFELDTEGLFNVHNEALIFGLQLPSTSAITNNLSYASSYNSIWSPNELYIVTMDNAIRIMKCYTITTPAAVEYVALGTLSRYTQLGVGTWDVGDDDWFIYYDPDTSSYSGMAGTNMQGHSINIAPFRNDEPTVNNIYYESTSIDAFDTTQLTLSANLMHEHLTKVREVMVLALYPDMINDYEPYKLAADPVVLSPITNDKRRRSTTLTFYDQVLTDGLLSNNTADLYFLYNYNSTDGIDESAVGALSVTDLKIEKGNTPSDWTPSPDDTESAIADVRNTMLNQKTEIVSDCQSIILNALEHYVETGDYDEFKKTVSAQLEVLADEISMKFSTVSQEVTDVNGELQTKFNEFYKYITFDGENGITIGSSDSSIKLIVDNDGILFTKDGATFGSWDGEDFHTGNIVVDVNERAQFGNYAFLPNSDGSLSFMKVGG